MAVRVNIDGEEFSHGSAHKLFLTRIPATEMKDVVHPYNVSKDGLFLMRVPGDDPLNPITILLNWNPDKR